MLFNSFEFLFFYMPLVIGGYFLFGKFNQHRLAKLWLLVAGLLFYGWWDAKYVPLLLGSILGNYLFSLGIVKAKDKKRETLSRGLFWAGVAADIAVLCWFKYMDFFLENVNAVLGTQYPLLHIVLPLGVSFFTITQLLYLFDCKEGTVKEHDFFDYALFVSFFPHLLAGPILYHRQMMMQLKKASLLKVNWDNLSIGFCLFIIGLTKKLVIADSFVDAVNFGFTHAASLDFCQSWEAVICYMMQLYFDFSGYSDMAVGLSRMMNISIPVNFNQPFRAVSVSNFWQRWHISLTSAITACVYMPLTKVFGKFGFCGTLMASSIALFIVGIWHGAGWTYVAFAALQAAGIAVNQLWKHFHLPMAKGLARIFTLLFLAVSFTFFRAANVGEAKLMLQGMTGGHGMNLPSGIADMLHSYLPDISCMASPMLSGLPEMTLAAALLLVTFCPDSNRIIKKLQPEWYFALAFAVAFVYSVLQLTKESPFLYFQF